MLMAFLFVSGCDQNLTASIGEIQSPNFPSPSSSHTKTVCKYKIKAPVGRRIQLNFHSHPLLLPDYSCYSGNLSIFEGDSPDLTLSTPAEKYCGSRSTCHKLYLSKGNSLLLVYNSSYGYTSFRFKLRYRFTLGKDQI